MQKTGESGKKRKDLSAWTAIFAVLLLSVLSLVNYFFPFYRFGYGYAVEARQEGQLRVHFLDVGLGDCTLIEFPDGKLAVLDTGGSSADASSEKTLLGALSSLGYPAVDYLFITLESSERTGGARAVMETLPVDKAYFPCEATLASSDEYRESYLLAATKASALTLPSRGEKVENAELGYKLVVLSPSEYRKKTEARSAELSLVLYLEYAGVSVLFTSDTGAVAQDKLVGEYELDNFFAGTEIDFTGIDVVKIARHGGKDAVSAEFLNAIGAKQAVVSCPSGSKNYPSGATVAEISNSGVQTLYRTDVCGNILLTLEKDGKYHFTHQTKK